MRVSVPIDMLAASSRTKERQITLAQLIREVEGAGTEG